MELETKKCPVCGRYDEILPSNNPLIQPTCNSCISGILKYNSAIDGDFFCRTYNIPFEPELWMRVAGEYKENTFREYILLMFDGNEYKTETREA
jgi:NMD protein affecting ribosome stability and mRNA decay